LSPRSIRREQQRRLARERRREGLRKRRALVAGATIGAAAVAAPAAQAAPFEVNTLNDAAADGCTTAVDGCTLRDAVTDAVASSEDDTITFQSGLSGTITLTQGEIPISGNNFAITINGPGTNVISVSGDADMSGTPNAGDSRIFNINPDSTSGNGAITISGLTLTDGYSAGGRGGAIYDVSNPLTLADAVVQNSTTRGSGNPGGGIATYAALTITGSTISGNRATNSNGGGIYAANNLTIKGSTISGNNASGTGGGIFGGGGKYGPLQISGSTISGNTAAGGGGIAHIPGKYAADNDLVESTVNGNNATDFGAGIALYDLGNTGESFDITRSTISNNGGTGTGLLGGGVATSNAVAGTFRTTNSTISGNGADKAGGVFIGNSGNAQVRPSGTLEFNNSTIAANHAAIYGGGIFLSYYQDGSGGYKSATIPLTSTVVAGNAAAGSPNDLDRGDPATSGGFDLAFSMVQAPGDAAISQSPPGSGIVGGDARLNPLANNGGPTQTMLPDILSPLVDKGLAPPRLLIDQRGQPRTVDTNATNAAKGDGTDIGAVELQTGPPATAVKKKKKCKHKRKRHSAEKSAKKKHKKCKKKKRKHR
jgi:predicted outer membrane repeat protein